MNLFRETFVFQERNQLQKYNNFLIFANFLLGKIFEKTNCYIQHTNLLFSRDLFAEFKRFFKVGLFAGYVYRVPKFYALLTYNFSTILPPSPPVGTAMACIRIGTARARPSCRRTRS